MVDRDWLAEGLRFECQGCGACCVSHGEFAYVYLAHADVVAIARHLGLPALELLERYCAQDPDGSTILRSLGPACVFLGAGGGCRVYPVRPKQCSTWPFWTENLNPSAWNGPVRQCCPGVGQGPRHNAAEVERVAQARDAWYAGDDEG